MSIMPLEAHNNNIQYVSLVVPLFTTFLGAWFAFLWQNHGDKRRQEHAKHGALLKAQALFYEFYEVILSIKRDFLDKHKEDKNRMAKVEHISFCQKFSELDFEGLSFILATKSPDLYGDIVNVYRKCISAIEAINERNGQYRKISNGKVEVEDLSTGEVKVSLSPADLIFLKDFTDIMYREADQALLRIKTIDDKLQKFIKKSFQGKHALKAVGCEKE
ncbi:MAG: hypothetical protein ABH844_01525 [Candidatus Omnitrophota bacterium]